MNQPLARAFAALLLLAGTACSAVLRYPAAADAEPTAWTQVLERGMNPFLLTNLLSRRVTVEIDWVEGHAPHPLALEALERTLREFCAPGKLVEILQDDEIPLDSWTRASAEAGGASRLVSEFLDHDPGRWEETELIYVLYVPRSDPWYGAGLYGLTLDVPVIRNGVWLSVPTVQVFAEQVRKGANLWITPARVDRAMLVHELGHVLGLVSHPGHTRRGHPGHCTEPQCVMGRPGARSTLYNALPALFAAKIPTKYCRRCRADVESVTALWRRQAETDPAFLERLRVRRRVREAVPADRQASAPGARARVE